MSIVTVAAWTDVNFDDGSIHSSLGATLLLRRATGNIDHVGNDLALQLIHHHDVNTCYAGGMIDIAITLPSHPHDELKVWLMEPSYERNLRRHQIGTGN